jgi:hypothetical protein
MSSGPQPSGDSRGAPHRSGRVSLDNTFALIEGHPRFRVMQALCRPPRPPTVGQCVCGPPAKVSISEMAMQPRTTISG